MSVRIHELPYKSNPVPSNEDLLVIETLNGTNYITNKITIQTLLTSHRGLDGYFETLSTININDLLANNVLVSGLHFANNAWFTNITANQGNFQVLTALRLSAINASMSTLNVGTISAAFINALSANIQTVNITLVELSGYGVTGTLAVSGSVVAQETLSGRNLRLTTPIANSLYVSMSGSDSNTGHSPFEPLRTIKKACEIAHNRRYSAGGSASTRFTVFVGTGDYTENNPILVPSNVSLIGDNLRRTNIYPQNLAYDILWVNDQTYVWGFTFRNHFAPAAAVAFPNWADTTAGNIAKLNLVTPNSAPFNVGFVQPYIFTSPYTQNCSSITSASATTLGNLSAGAGMRIDGSLAQGYLRSMVLDAYTQFNASGKGIHIINNGYAQLVSIFTICCTEGVMCETGGTCSINNSNCSFGLSGLVAVGASPKAILSGVLVSAPINGNEFRISTATTNGTPLYPGSLFNTIANSPYNGLVFTVDNDPNTPLNPSTQTIYTIDGTPVVQGGEHVIQTIQPIRQTFIPGQKVNFYLRSTVTASSHTFEYIGTGVNLQTAVPALGGKSTVETEVATDDLGSVYYTSTNQTGNFSVGNDFTIVQETGTIEGDTFKRSILALVTPLTLALE